MVPSGWEGTLTDFKKYKQIKSQILPLHLGPRKIIREPLTCHFGWVCFGRGGNRSHLRPGRNYPGSVSEGLLLLFPPTFVPPVFFSGFPKHITKEFSRRIIGAPALLLRAGAPAERESALPERAGRPRVNYAQAEQGDFSEGALGDPSVQQGYHSESTR